MESNPLLGLVPHYRGVTYDRRCKKWRARLYCLGRHVTLGRFSDAARAAEIHDRAAYMVFKEAAVTNFGVAAARTFLQCFPSGCSERVLSCLRVLEATVARKNQPARPGQDSMHIFRKHAAAIAAGAVVSQCGSLNDAGGVCRGGGAAFSGSRRGVQVAMVLALVRLAIAVSPSLLPPTCRSFRPAAKRMIVRWPDQQSQQRAL